jgi:uncharacterized membrane protein
VHYWISIYSLVIWLEIKILSYRDSQTLKTGDDACFFSEKPYNSFYMEQVLTRLYRHDRAIKGLVYGSVALLLLGWLLNTPAGLLGKADAIGYAVCHRIDVRSFHLGDRPLPLCARCSGMYLGAMLGLVYQSVFSRRRTGTPPLRVIIPLGLMALAFVVDGTNSFLHLIPGAPGIYEPTNTLRLFTGTGMGLVIAAMLFPAFNQTVWKDWDPKPAFPTLMRLGGLALLALALDGLVLTGNSWVLYPLALLSAVGVLVLLTMVYSMVLLLVLRFENRFRAAYQLALPLVGGFGIGLLQIILLDLLRFALTHTWDGFHLG